ncbi:MAG: hypothetical protein RL230_1768 [Pseudomonadota bacterium]|jgi:hypothetical protein
MSQTPSESKRDLLLAKNLEKRAGSTLKRPLEPAATLALAVDLMPLSALICLKTDEWS